MIRRVRGTLFVDYVRMIRGNKHVDWSRYLEPEDLALLDAKIDPEAWYPMDTFERYGLGIVREVAGGQLDAVTMWGQFQVDTVRRAFPTLVASGNPRETLMRFHALHRGFFDYDAVVVHEALDESARIHVQYAMSAEAEEAACHQTMGFFGRLVECAGGDDVRAEFARKSWVEGGAEIGGGADHTVIDLRWTMLTSGP